MRRIAPITRIRLDMRPAARLATRLVLAAGFLAAGTALASAWSFGNVYQEKVNRFCTSTPECAKAFPDVPAGKVMQVRHFSCGLVAADARQTRQIYLRLTSRKTAETMIFQQPFTLKAKLDGNNWWVVEGNPDFFVPADTTIEVVYSGSGTLVTRVDCALSGILSNAG
ncbi:hypothetical protein [Oharaeibacter diazotrophicus]|uniref:Uncharacterized protein n=1 Tax=Oharaeibacter diazotrophicus TaxID=1920512 RepID=A0A4R6RHE3_9HYPH|nr:hypothetical protein [Oharaeibacter diazotrophicus]TDP85585.1 hypothetical protein EDD54_2439 [Oharaeibacter diazotrophicus]BBE74556.1 hypothetical protein OHA_1_04187 [Pleomorphomonas sp. SM30]GLS75745.1 hypothetical protein GCM10007904_10800 [Oharaeibacter diazotrophicus]